MKNLVQLENAVKQARQHKQTADTAYTSLGAAMAALPREGFTSDYLNKQTAAIRERFVPTILAALGEIKKIADAVRPSELPWQSKEMILSLRPVTKSAGNHPFAPAEDMVIEAAVRLSKMTEFEKYSTSLLELHSAAALDSGQLGLFYLLNREYNTRHADPGYSPVDMDKVVLEDQEQALNHFREIKSIEVNTENLWRQAQGKPLSPSQKITAGRMAEGVKHYALQ